MLASGHRLPPEGWRRRWRLLSMAVECYGLDPVAPVAGYPFQYHAADVAIVGANPLLTALAVQACIDRGLAAMVLLSGSHDLWAYELVRHPAYRAYVEKVTGYPGLDPADQANPYLPAVASANDPEDVATTAWLTGLFSHIGDAVGRAGSGQVGRFDDGLAFVLAERSAPEEALIYVHREDPHPDHEGGPVPKTEQTYRKLRAACWGGVLRRVPRWTFDTRADTRDFLFARRVLLTSNVYGFHEAQLARADSGEVRLSYAHPFVRAVGTARRIAANPGEALEQALEDILETGTLLDDLANRLARPAAATRGTMEAQTR